MTKSATVSERFYIITNSLMILIYALAGVGLLFWNASSIPFNSRKIFSIALFLYAIYRAYNLIRRFKNAKAEN